MRSCSSQFEALVAAHLKGVIDRDCVGKWPGDKVKSPTLHHRFVIALHSPVLSAETGLRGSLSEKNAANSPDAEEYDISLVRFASEKPRFGADFGGFLQGR